MNNPTQNPNPSPSQSQQKLSLKPIYNVMLSLSSLFVGREWEIEGVLTSLISGEPCLLVSPPGTGKTMLIDALSKHVNCSYFYYMLTRFTEPDELFGPLDINALREGKYVRITRNRLPEADIVFLDEVFKASSAIRNTLLDIILNKRFMNGTSYVALPMLTLYTSSNEISTDEEDMAFYDRLTIRLFFKNVPQTLWETLLINGVKMTYADIKPTAVVNKEYVKQLQDFVRRRTASIIDDPNLRSKILSVVSELSLNGIELSDRRKIKLVHVFSAVSTLFVEEVPTPDSLADAVRMVAVVDEDSSKKVDNVISKLKLTSIDITKILVMINEVTNVIESVRNHPDIGSIKALKSLRNRMVDELNNLPKNIRSLRARKMLEDAILSVDNVIKSLGI